VATPLQLSPTLTAPQRRVIAIAGNPNTGKTTLFNALTGTRQKVGNYPGVTVERKVGNLRLPSGEVVDIVDLPGCYSLAARSPEEQIAHDVLMGELEGEAKPDLVIVVLDASNLQRNLFLATQLRDLRIPMVVGLNMLDLAKERGMDVSQEKLAQALGCPVVPLIARKGQGLSELAEVLERDPCGTCNCSSGIPRFIDCLPKELEQPVLTLSSGLVDSGRAPADAARAQALWLLISTLEGDEAISISPVQMALTRRVLKQYKLSTRQVRAIETGARYRYLKDLMFLAACVEQDLPHRLTDRLDRVLLHRVAGPLVFLGIMSIVFQSIFSWAEPAMGGIEIIVGALSRFVGAVLPAGLFRDMIVDGAIAGAGNVLVFMPQILILFLFIGLLEDVGYMARAAFLMDRIMAKVGLDGRAFLPLLSSFACAIPGIMAARTISGRKDRLVTNLVAPLMSCSARLPVYTLVIGTVFLASQPVLGVFTVGGLVLMSMYLLSIVTAITMAAIFKKTILKSPPPPLFLELPTYKLPSAKTLVLNMLDRAKLFAIQAGTVILASTVILWAIMNIQVGDGPGNRFEDQRARVASNLTLNETARVQALAEISQGETAWTSENSLGGRLGKLIEPVISPLGFDWKIGIGIIGSFAAREVFIGSMAVVHGISDADENNPTLREKLQSEVHPETGARIFTPLVGVALMVFYVLACQCISTVAIVRRETQSWKWPLFMIAYMSVLAWLGAFAVYQGGKLLGYS
jgi:ferrous iron transport protein B